MSWNKKFNSHKGWQNDNDDVANAIAIDGNNNLYVAGYGSSYREVWIKKFDNNGNEDLSWNKKANIDNYWDSVDAIVIDSNNNLYVTGNHSFSPNIWGCGIRKFDLNGNEDLNWNKEIDTNNSADYIKSIAIDSNNNIYVAGYGYNLVSSSSGHDWWIKKFNSEGKEDMNWNKKISSTGYYDDSTTSIAIDSNNNVYVAGYGYNLVSSLSDDDWWIKKFDSNGNEDLTWDKKIDYSWNDKPNSIKIDKDGNIWIAGYGTNLVNSDSRKDWLIKKYHPDGTEEF